MLPRRLFRVEVDTLLAIPKCKLIFNWTAAIWVFFYFSLGFYCYLCFKICFIFIDLLISWLGHLTLTDSRVKCDYFKGRTSVVPRYNRHQNSRKLSCVWVGLFSSKKAGNHKESWLGRFIFGQFSGGCNEIGFILGSL